jgi:hypothetical protein
MDVAGWKFVISDIQYGNREIWTAYIADFAAAQAAFERQAELTVSKKVTTEPMTSLQLIALGLGPHAVKLISL